MLRRASSPCAVALGLVLAGSGAASAQGVSLNRAGSGARAAGMGDAFAAVSDDGTAASWNPAGLAQLRQPELSLVYVVSNRAFSVAGLRSPDQSVSYSGADMDATSSSVDFASAALPFSVARKPVTLQVGWRRLYQLSNVFGGEFDRYLTSAQGTRAGSVFLEDRLVGDIDVLSVAVAVKLTSRAALGGSLDFWRGGWRNRLTLVEEPGPGGTTAFLSNRGRARLRGHNATVGMLLTYPSWNAGLVYHFPFWSSLDLREEVDSTQFPSEEGDARARFRLPRSVGGGLAWRLARRWTVSTALTHDQWTDALLDGVPGAPGPVNFFDGAPPSVSTTRDTLALNLGAEHLFVREGAVVPLRFGLGWEPQGAMDPITRDPVDYTLVSAGGGYNTNRVKLDAAVQYRWTSYRSSNRLSVGTAAAGPFQYDALGRASNNEWRIKVSAIYRIQDTQKLREILRRIFG
jgi:long-subunit fatty acid transport protein